MIRFFWKWAKRFAAVFLMLCLAAGMYAGNRMYEGLLESPWDQILGIKNQTGQLARIHEIERRAGWEPAEVTAGDGTVLAGTYVPRERPSHYTVVLVHGLYSNRAMCESLVPLYQALDYNVLLIDLRGHGESGGRHTLWGMKETGDFAAWKAWLLAKDPEMRIGVHGVSLGAAMAILWSGSESGQDLRFCIADSSYADLFSLGREKLFRWTGDERLLLAMDALNPFFQAAMFLHSGCVLSDIDPLSAAGRMRAPALFLHGADDTLIPPESAEKLGGACASRRKAVRIFEGAGHAREFAENPEAYTRIVQDFIRGE